LELQAQYGFKAAEIERIEIDIFDVAFKIIGGGEEGDKTIVRTKEEADHSLQYMVGVALIDGNVLPAQYAPDRILRGDIQALLHRFIVRPSGEYTKRFPREVCATVRVTLTDGRTVSIDKTDYEGFYTRPMSWGAVIDKFNDLAKPFTSERVRKMIIDAVHNIERMRVRDFTVILAHLTAEPDRS
jgi:2-methylcitrate dehydratase